MHPARKLGGKTMMKEALLACDTEQEKRAAINRLFENIGKYVIKFLAEFDPKMARRARDPAMLKSMYTRPMSAGPGGLGGGPGSAVHRLRRQRLRNIGAASTTLPIGLGVGYASMPEEKPPAPPPGPPSLSSILPQTR